MTQKEGELDEQRVATGLLARIEHHVRRTGDDKGLVIGLDKSETNLVRRLLSGLVSGALAFLVLSVPGDVRAHDFYSIACCAGKDCKPEHEWKVTVKITDKGYFIEQWGETIPFDDTRVKPIPPVHDSGVFHVCKYFVNGRPAARCLYKPNFYQ
jgi:hypothetical protein